MGASKGQSERQAQAAAGGRTAFVAAIKAVEDMRYIPLGNTGAGIGDFHLYKLPISCRRQVDHTAGRGVFQGIVQEIGDDPLQTRTIAIDHQDFGRLPELQLDTTILGQGDKQIDRFLDNPGNIERTQVEFNRSGVGLSDFQHRCNHLNQVVALIDN